MPTAWRDDGHDFASLLRYWMNAIDAIVGGIKVIIAEDKNVPVVTGTMHML